MNSAVSIMNAELYFIAEYFYTVMTLLKVATDNFSPFASLNDIITGTTVAKATGLLNMRLFSHVACNRNRSAINLTFPGDHMPGGRQNCIVIVKFIGNTCEH